MEPRILPVTCNGQNYDVLYQPGRIVNVFYHNTDKPVPAWQLMRGELMSALLSQAASNVTEAS